MKNLTVTGVKRVTLDKPVPVYDLTSSKYENFTLASGAVVHNSALGSAINAKLPWQEILPLRGKLPNLVSKPRLSKNEIVNNIMNVIGYDAKNPDRPLRVGKVILLCDADDDGAHIEVLLLTALWRKMPEILQRGILYTVDGPLYEAMDRNNDQVTGNVLRDMEREHGKLKNVNRMKGWGGCEAPLLRRVAFAPETRRWIAIRAPTPKEEIQFQLLLGKDSGGRKELSGGDVDNSVE